MCVTLPEDVGLMFHEKLIEFIGNTKPSEKQVYEKFKDYSYILGHMLRKEEAGGTIRSYDAGGIKRYECTEAGEHAVRFAKDVIRISKKNEDEE